MLGAYANFYVNCVPTQPRLQGLIRFFGIKNERITVTKLVFILNDQWHLSLKWAFLTERLDTIYKTWMVWSFLLYNKQKLLDMSIFPKIASIAKKWLVP